MTGTFAHGATLSIGGTAIGLLTSIGLPERTRDELETTDHQSSGTDEYIPGLRRGGSVSFEGRLATGATGDAGMDALETNLAAASGSAIEEFIITLPDNAGATATTYTFDGFVTALNGNLPYDSLADFSCTVKVTGTVVKAKATAA